MLQSKRVLITGSSGGAGKGIAKAFAVAGAHVVLPARNREKLEGTRAEIEAQGGIVDAVIPGDLSTKAGCYAVAKACGPIDVLVNNAAETSAKFMSILTRDDDYWEREFHACVYRKFGPFRRNWRMI